MHRRRPAAACCLTLIAWAAAPAGADPPLPIEWRVQLTGNVRDEPFEICPAGTRTSAAGGAARGQHTLRSA